MTGVDYAQTDPRWGSLFLGRSKKEKFAQFGCLVTAGTNVATALGHMITPDYLNDQLTAKGLYTGSEGDDVSTNDFLSRVFPDIQFVERRDWRTSLADLSYFNVGGDISTEIIVLLDSHPNQAGLQQHWCRVIGREGDDVRIVDSWDGKRKLLGQSYGAPAAKLIYAALKFHKTMTQGQVPVQQRIVAFAKGDTLYGIALREHTTVAALRDLNRDVLTMPDTQIPVGLQVRVP